MRVELAALEVAVQVPHGQFTVGGARGADDAVHHLKARFTDPIL